MGRGCTYSSYTSYPDGDMTAYRNTTRAEMEFRRPGYSSARIISAGAHHSYICDANLFAPSGLGLPSDQVLRNELA